MKKGKATESMLDGVCAGIANHFELDVTLVRFIFLVCGLSFFYLVLMFIMDEPDEN